MKAHRTDFVSLVFSLLFLGAATWWVIGDQLGVDTPRAAGGAIVVGALILFGVLGLVGAARPRPQAAEVEAMDEQH